MESVLSYTPKAYVRKPAPDFKGTAWTPEGFKDIQLSDYKGKWLVLFFYPLDFTFVCPTEICNYSDAYDKFAKVSKFYINIRLRIDWMFY